MCIRDSINIIKTQLKYYINEIFQVIWPKLDEGLLFILVIFYPILIIKSRVGKFVQFFHLLNEFSQVCGYLISVQYHLKLLQCDFQKTLSIDPKDDQENINFPHRCEFPPSPMILVFFENLIELKF